MNCKNYLSLLLLVFLSFHQIYAQTEEEFMKFSKTGTVTSSVQTVRLPIEIWNELILIKVKINDDQVNFMWDTGFSISGIDQSFIEKFKFIPFGDQDNSIALVDGNNQTLNLTYFVCPELSIDAISIKNTPFLKFDSKSITLSDDLKIEGILGASIINKLNWIFNFDEGYVEISQKPFDTKSAQHELSFAIDEMNMHMMPISFFGLETECLIDFGSNSETVDIFKQNAQYFKNSKATKIIGFNSVSVGGIAASDTIYNIKDNYDWKLGNVDLKFLPKLSFSKHNRNVVIGNRIFRDRFNVIINTTSPNTVYAISKRLQPRSFDSDRDYGFKVLKIEDQMKIAQILPNKNVSKYGLNLMDVVVSLNQLKVNNFKDNYSLIDYQKQLAKANKPLVVELQNGKKITLLPEELTNFEYIDDMNMW